ncbi:MAG: hypothetical protein ACRYFS_21875 [Janthinobacterium lividum]
MKPRFSLDDMEPMAVDDFWAVIDTVHNEVIDREGEYANRDPYSEEYLAELEHFSTADLGAFGWRAHQLTLDGGSAIDAVVFHRDDDDDQKDTILFTDPGYLPYHLADDLIRAGRCLYETVVKNPEPTMRVLYALDTFGTEKAPMLLCDLASEIFERRTAFRGRTNCTLPAKASGSTRRNR